MSGSGSNIEGESLVEEPTTPVPWWGKAAIGGWVALVIGGYIGTALGTTWANEHPLGLIALHARIRHLLLALGNELPWWEYGLVAGLRLGAAYFVSHLIGRAYGDQVLYYFGRYLGMTREAMDAIERSFDKVDWLVVPWFAGSNFVAAFTGIRKMEPVRLAGLVTLGIVARLVLLWWLAQVFTGTLDTVLNFLSRYQTPFLIVSIALVFVTMALNMRRGRNFE